jgi:signal recognition particle receptor subunit beta
MARGKAGPQLPFPGWGATANGFSPVLPFRRETAGSGDGLGPPPELRNRYWQLYAGCRRGRCPRRRRRPAEGRRPRLRAFGAAGLRHGKTIGAEAVRALVPAEGGGRFPLDCGTFHVGEGFTLAFVNLKNKEVQAKVVYYGPGRGGKTTNLEYVYGKFRERIKSDMVSIKTHGDRTLFFDFLPFDIGKIMGYDVRIQLYTVPGQVKYNATRRLVLKGVDGMVFVADSQVNQREKNLMALKNLQENLAIYKKSIFKVPLVLQYNKRDLEKEGVQLMSMERMEKDLNSQLKVPSFGASAVSGENVIPTLKKIVSLTMASLQKVLK